MKKIKSVSPAKINLTLEIIKKLPDGFHNLRSLMVKTENLQDEIEITFSEKQKGIKIICNNKSIPTDEKNICWKVADNFFRVLGKEVGLKIKIKKKIPTLAGLGGGSSNGATVLLALNKYFKKPLKFKELVEIASLVGKDIPVFLLKKRAILVSGAGERLRPIKNFPQLNFLIVNPKGEIATGWAYGELDKRMWFMEDKRRKNISRKMLKNIDSVEKIGGLLYNDFDLVAEELFPVIRELKNCLLSLGALGVSITGKGPTVIGIFQTFQEAVRTKKIIQKNYPDFFVKLG